MGVFHFESRDISILKEESPIYRILSINIVLETILSYLILIFNKDKSGIVNVCDLIRLSEVSKYSYNLVHSFKHLTYLFNNRFEGLQQFPTYTHKCRYFSDTSICNITDFMYLQNDSMSDYFSRRVKPMIKSDYLYRQYLNCIGEALEAWTFLNFEMYLIYFIYNRYGYESVLKKDVKKESNLKKIIIPCGWPTHELNMLKLPEHVKSLVINTVIYPTLTLNTSHIEELKLIAGKSRYNPVLDCATLSFKNMKTLSVNSYSLDDFSFHNTDDTFCDFMVFDYCSFRTFCKFKNVRHLKFNKTEFSEYPELENVEKLTLNSVAYFSFGFLSGLDSLKCLNIAFVNYQSHKDTNLNGLENIEELHLSGIYFNTFDIDIVETLPRFRNNILSITESTISGDSKNQAIFLGKLTGVTSLSLNKITGLTNMAGLANEGVRIKNLNIDYNEIERLHHIISLDTFSYKGFNRIYNTYENRLILDLMNQMDVEVTYDHINPFRSINTRYGHLY